MVSIMMVDISQLIHTYSNGFSLTFVDPIFDDGLKKIMMIGPNFTSGVQYDGRQLTISDMNF